MKRFLSILLAGALLASLLTGCAAKDGASEKSNKNTKNSNEASNPKEEKAEYTMKETVLADNEFYTFTVKGAEEHKDENGNGVRLNVSITNKTEEALIFIISEFYINGYSAPFPDWDPDSEYAYVNPIYKSMGMADEITGVEVPGGETAEIFCQNRLKDHVGKIADEMYFQLHADEKDYYEANLVTSSAERKMPSSIEFYTIYPTGKNADSVAYPEPEKIKDEILIEDNEYIKLIFQECKQQTDTSSIITYYAENKSDVTLSLNMTNIKINGKDVNAGENMYFSHNIYSGKRELDTIYFGEYTSGYTGEEIKELSFTLTVNDTESRSILYTADYSVTF